MSFSVVAAVLYDVVDGLRDRLRMTLGSRAPTADFTKFTRRPAELVVVVVVTLVLHDDRD